MGLFDFFSRTSRAIIQREIDALNASIRAEQEYWDTPLSNDLMDKIMAYVHADSDDDPAREVAARSLATYRERVAEWKRSKGKS